MTYLNQSQPVDHYTSDVVNYSRPRRPFNISSNSVSHSCQHHPGEYHPPLDSKYHFVTSWRSWLWNQTSQTCRCHGADVVTDERVSIEMLLTASLSVHLALMWRVQGLRFLPTSWLIKTQISWIHSKTLTQKRQNRSRKPDKTLPPVVIINKRWQEIWNPPLVNMRMPFQAVLIQKHRSSPLMECLCLVWAVPRCCHFFLCVDSMYWLLTCGCCAALCPTAWSCSSWYRGNVGGRLHSTFPWFSRGRICVDLLQLSIFSSSSQIWFPQKIYFTGLQYCSTAYVWD